MSKRKNPSQSDITHEEWLAELAKIGEMGPQGDGLTTNEICERQGIHRTTATKLLRQAAKLGKLIVTRKRVPCLDGVRRLSPAYKWKK